MDTAWIQVFLLTMSECIAPSGKTVCQQQEFQLEFATAEACEIAREQFVALKDQMDNVIVNRDRTRCSVTAREQRVFASADDVTGVTSTPADRQTVVAAAKSNDPSEMAHKERLDSLPSCEDARGRRPCKIGQIILEDDTQQSAEVWQRQN